jgi:ADP-L-glycero-D-manno-heptose 6-epimerase
MNLYAESKVAFETAVDMINPKIIVQGFRYFNVYGEGDDHKGDQASPHTKFRSQYSETGRISVFHGSENFVRDFVPVEDVCRMHTLFLRVPESGIWNVGTGETTSFLQVALSIAPIENIDFIDMPENVKNHYQQYTCADMTKTRETLRRHGIET